MDSFLDVLVDTFLDIDSPTIVELDRESLEDTGEWTTETTIPIDEIINAFRLFQDLSISTDSVLVPLHKPDSPDLTGEYLVYRRETNDEVLNDDSDPHELHYTNTARDTSEFLELSNASNSYLAYRTRFWSAEFDLPEQPSYLPTDYHDDRPPNPQREVTAPNPFTDDQLDTYVDTVYDSLKYEFTSTQKEEWQTHRGMSLERIIRIQSGIDAASFSTSSNEIRVSAPTTVQSRTPVETQYSIYPGNIVAIDVDDINNTPIVPGALTRTGYDSFSVEPNWDLVSNPEVPQKELQNASTVSVGVIARTIALQRERDAFEQMIENNAGAELLSGQKTLTFDSPVAERLNTSIELNRYQRRATVNALRADDAYCIHGPPGTGKTRTLTAIIEATVKNGGRVLVCTHSNQAIDNLIAGGSTPSDPDPDSLHGVIQDSPEMTLTRVGDDIKSRVVQEYYTDIEESRARIIATTTNTADRLDTRWFDLVVIDEATQANVPATAVPFNICNRIVLAGDHKQLPPYSSKETDTDEEFQPSLFEHLIERYGDDIMTTLRRQYRMHEDIAEFSNNQFYDGLLRHGDANRDATIADLEPLIGIHCDGEQSWRNDSYANEDEADIVVAQVNKLLTNEIDPSNIGVITPYRGQIGVVEDALREQFGSNVERQMKVQTIDSFQGGQREAIIISFARSNDSNKSGFLEFPNEGPRRLNVALTRAKKRLVIIGNWETLTNPADHLSEDESCAHVYNDLAEYITAKSQLYGYTLF